MLAWTKQNTMQRAMRAVLEWPQSPATSKTINMITNKYEPQQTCRLGTVSKNLLGDLNRFYGYPTSPSASVMAQNIQLSGPHEGFLTHQWIITGNKLITDKYYDEKRLGLDSNVLRPTKALVKKDPSRKDPPHSSSHYMKGTFLKYNLFYIQLR